MTPNMGTADRLLRVVVVAPALVAAGLAAGGLLAVVLYVLAAVMVVTAVAGSCPLYSVAGVRTCPRASGPAGA